MSKEIKKEMNPIISDIKTLIEQSRQQIAVSINAAMSILYWQIGKRINSEVLQNQRAEYGRQIVATLSRQLTQEYGSGWSQRHLFIVLNLQSFFLIKTFCTHCVQN